MKADKIKMEEESTVVTSVQEIPSETPPMETPPVVLPVDDGKLRPDEWAIKKDLLKIHKDGSIDYRVLIPWQFNVMKGLAKWPDPNADPTFKITEEEFNKVLEQAKGF